jgi:hypothetical protein
METLSSMGYLTINTQSNRVVIISSVITRIFFNPVGVPGQSHFNHFNQDARDLFMLCITNGLIRD